MGIQIECCTTRDDLCRAEMGYNQITEHRETRFCVKPGPRRLTRWSLGRAVHPPTPLGKLFLPRETTTASWEEEKRPVFVYPNVTPTYGSELACVCSLLTSQFICICIRCPAMTVITTSSINYTRRHLAHLKPFRLFISSAAYSSSNSSSSLLHTLHAPALPSQAASKCQPHTYMSRGRAPRPHSPVAHLHVIHSR